MAEIPVGSGGRDTTPFLGRSGSGLRVPQSPHPSERHDHRSDPVYAAFQKKLCVVIIVGVIILTAVSIGTHHYGSDDEPAPAGPGTPAFPPAPFGTYQSAYARITTGPSQFANVTSYHYKNGNSRTIEIFDLAVNYVQRLLISFDTGKGVEYEAHNTTQYCNTTTAFGTVPPIAALVNATYLGITVLDEGDNNAVMCDTWRGWQAADWRHPQVLVEVMYWQSRDTGHTRRIQIVNKPSDDFFVYDFQPVGPPLAWFQTFTCPVDVRPLPPSVAQDTGAIESVAASARARSLARLF